MAKRFDAIIIGAGQAGPPLAVKLAKDGKKVALIERKLLGGTCINTGCIPTKALIASAQAIHTIKTAEEFGVTLNDGIDIDMQKIKARKDAIVAKYANGLEKWLKDTSNCTLYHEHARFENNHTLRVGDDILEAERLFINVGARAAVPKIPGLEKVSYFTNSSMMSVDFVPEHLIIIGGSYIGLEFAQMYRRFGAKVTVIEKDSRLIPREDADISDEVKKILETEGIKIRLNAECIAFDSRNGKIAAKVSCEEPDKEVIGSHLLLALGRTPNTDDLGLDKAGVTTNKKGFIEVDDQLLTSVPNIWALGECNGKGAFTHTSYNDYEIIAANLSGEHPRKVSDRILTYGLFIDPPLGRAGQTEQEIQKSGIKALVGKKAMSQVKRAVIKGEVQGFMKIIVAEDSKQILGAAVLGVGGDEIIHSILDVMYTKAPYTVIQNAVHIHPTVSELIPTMLGELKPLI